MHSWSVLTSVHTHPTISTITTRPWSQLGIPLSCRTPDVSLHNYRLVLSTLEYRLNGFEQCFWISRHVVVFIYSSVPFCCCVEFHCTAIPPFVSLFTSDGYFAVIDNVFNYNKYVLGDTCFKWFGVAPKCFSKANVLFYTVVDGTDLRLSDKCLLTYGTADAVTQAGEGTEITLQEILR